MTKNRCVNWLWLWIIQCRRHEDDKNTSMMILHSIKLFYHWFGNMFRTVMVWHQIKVYIYVCYHQPSDLHVFSCVDTRATFRAKDFKNMIYHSIHLCFTILHVSIHFIGTVKPHILALLCIHIGTCGYLTTGQWACTKPWRHILFKLLFCKDLFKLVRIYIRFVSRV